MTPTKSKVQKKKLPRVVLKTESKAAVAAEIARAMKSKAHSSGKLLILAFLSSFCLINR
jgi:hypothetical protein